MGLLAWGDRPDARGPSQIGGAVQRTDTDRLHRCETFLDEQLELALVGVAGDDPAAARRIGPRDQQAAGAREGALERERLRKERLVNRLRVLRSALVALLELLLQLRQQHAQPRRHGAPGW